MKKKDMIALVISVVIMLVAGYLVYTQVVPQKAANMPDQGSQVEVVGEIKPDFDATALSMLEDGSKVRNFSITFDLKDGLNNQAVFGQ